MKEDQINMDASDVIHQCLKKDDSLALEELTKTQRWWINVSRETLCRKLNQIGNVSKVPV